MKIVINIPKEVYERCRKFELRCGEAEILEGAVANGTPLPEGHGRILDEKDILDIEKNKGLIYDLVDMPEYLAGVSAIIEADREVEE